ncbi:MAG TPA: LysM peptidoglycan-binding domain-containing protein [Chitinophagaceae bacterium]
MKNLVFVLFIFFTATIISKAQPGQLMTKSGDKGLYLDHNVVAKEGFFSIGRLYNVHPKFLADYNDLDINKGLNIGQVIRIPLTDTNFSQRTRTATPVYYRVGEKEGLMKVSNANYKVNLQNLREWNKLSNDNINAGSKLIVGFLVRPDAPPVVVPNTVKEEPKKAVEEKPQVKTETVAQKPVVKEEIKKPDPVQEKAVVKEEPKKNQPANVKQEVNANMTGQGYFKSFFDQQVKQTPISRTETVTSGIFNTNNGLQDAKYYLLINGVIPGTIVRIINPDNNKTVYAKVLGEMNGIRQNRGLDIRISNLAAATLGVTDTEKFIVKVNY